MPDKPAVIVGDRSLDYATLNRRANQAANAITKLGCQADDRIAAMSFNSLAHFEISHGLRRIGAVIVPVNYRLRGHEVAYVLNDSGARIVFADEEHRAVVDGVRAELSARPALVTTGETTARGWLRYRDLMSAPPAPSAPPPHEWGGAQIGASMVYTSGTTGNPKGAWRPNGANLAYMLQMISIFELTQSDVHLVCGPLYHSAVGFFSVLYQVLGATSVVQPKFDAEQALEQIERHRVTTSFMAPTLLMRLVEAQESNPRDVSSLRAIFLGAAPCPYSLKARAEKAFGQVLWEFYGATETGINTVLRPEDQLRRPGSCGTAVEGQEIKLVDAEGNEVATGVPGEFTVRNEVLAEYYNKPEATTKNLHDGFFSVGDIAYKDGEGYFYICDRKVDMIISGGVNIYPAEIEAVLVAHPAVQDAAVIGVPDDQWGESVKAVVQRRLDVNATEDELIAFCAERLAGYKKPRSIDFVDELPRDAAGKLLKRRIREPYWAEAGRRI
jgi:fatty-acyl-CoA synthase/long-chain acyl-CoA synthetase